MPTYMRVLAAHIKQPYLKEVEKIGALRMHHTIEAIEDDTCLLSS